MSKLKILMTQQEIADATGYSQSAIHYIFNGDRIPSVNRALSLERATGICREAWLFPERHWNPYIPFEDIKSCMTCPNRSNRIKKSIEMAEIHFEQAENKKKAFKGMIEIYKTYTSVKGVEFVWRKILPEGLKLLACGGRYDYQLVPELLNSDTFKQLYQFALNKQSIVDPHFPYNIPKSLAEEIYQHFPFKLRSLMCIARDYLFFSMYSDVLSMNWTDSGVKNAEKHVERISTLWEEYKKINPNEN